MLTGRQSLIQSYIYTRIVILMVAVALLAGVPPSVANTVMKYEATSSLSKLILAFLVTIPEVGSGEQPVVHKSNHDNLHVHLLITNALFVLPLMISYTMSLLVPSSSSLAVMESSTVAVFSAMENSYMSSLN